MRWQDVETAAPELAGKVRARFEAHGLALLATLRATGAPRISGIEVLFGEGELWLGMMPGSVKAKDLLRDPRLALHSATADKDVAEGDAKLSGAAVPVEDEETFARYVRASGGGEGQALGSFHLFRVDVAEMSHLVPAGDHLDIEWWSERAGYRRSDRY
ncbi:MAG TPA: pyridoxamine 5'-phosphate oxidase family protein [Actinomycetota bacterium]|nr:pyridoxamine 5'-phosphate oxidase family protein [Actinomycetota bacterium]